MECMWLRRVPPPVWADNIADAFAFLHDEGGTCFNLTLHPWVTGQAHRIRWLRDALSRVLGRGAIWQATTDEVANAAREQL
jgi:allantoinase